MLDIFFLSYNEPYADDNYKKLLQRFPTAKRVNGITGFRAAHQECARLSMTENFYVVDSDAIIQDDFNFSFKPSKFMRWWDIPQTKFICLFQSVNPINGLIYGHGGVKILPKQGILESDTNSVDFTTGSNLPIKMFDQVSNVTKFNHDEFSTWRCAYREAVKLVMNLNNQSIYYKLNDDVLINQYFKDSKDRLRVWCSLGKNKPYGEYCIEGARQGKFYAQSNKDNNDALSLINDLEWMKNEFDKFIKS
jgi:hypothetical protein